MLSRFPACKDETEQRQTSSKWQLICSFSCLNSLNTIAQSAHLYFLWVLSLFIVMYFQGHWINTTYQKLFCGFLKIVSQRLYSMSYYQRYTLWYYWTVKFVASTFIDSCCSTHSIPTSSKVNWKKKAFRFWFIMTFKSWSIWCRFLKSQEGHESLHLIVLVLGFLDFF